MASPSVTYTFANSTTADATQVNTNFNDILSHMTSALIDYSMLTLIVSSTATFNGAVTLGNASDDDITVSGSLSSTIPIKTTYSYDIGSSTKGLKDVYLGSSDSAARTTKITGATVASSWSLTLPTSAGTDRYNLKTNGSGVTEWAPELGVNYAITASVAANALTIALKGINGSDPSSTNKVDIAFRNTTVATGTPVLRSVSAATSVVVSSGSTLGQVSAVAEYIYVYAIDNAGTVELAVQTSRTVDTGSVITTTAEGGAGAADDRFTIYSTTARSNVPCRLIGRIKSTQATAGTWASAVTEITTIGLEQDQFKRSQVIVHTGNGHGSTNTRIRRFTTTESNVGSDITYADSATNGASFTINTAGLYFFSFNDKYDAAAFAIGVSLNSSQLTTTIDSITAADRKAHASVSATNVGTVSGMEYLKPGDIIRPHTDSTPDSVLDRVKFVILRVA